MASAKEIASETVTEDNKQEEEIVEETKFFECSSCNLREVYEYFGRNPPYSKRFVFNEDSYIIEDPFQPPKQGEFIILGAHCKDCTKSFCKDSQCSFYYDGTYCIECARKRKYSFPSAVQEKLNKVGY